MRSNDIHQALNVTNKLSGWYKESKIADVLIVSEQYVYRVFEKKSFLCNFNFKLTDFSEFISRYLQTLVLMALNVDYIICAEMFLAENTRHLRFYTVKNISA